MKRRILLAPDVMNLSENHRISILAHALRELGADVAILGQCKYAQLFDLNRYQTLRTEYDSSWMNQDNYRLMHDLDERGFDFIDPNDLERFVREEVALLKELEPDAVISGYRPTLGISTKIARTTLVSVFCATCADAYFDAKLATLHFGLRDRIPPFRILPRGIGNALFRWIAHNTPRRIHAWNTVMKRHGLKPFISPYQLLHGDLNLLTDAPELFPEFGKLPGYYEFCGPMLMKNSFEMPDSARKYQKRAGRPLVICCMGSTGSPEIVKAVIRCFEGQPMDLFVATASLIDRSAVEPVPTNVYLEEVFPLPEVLAMCDAAVIHGGQGTVYQVNLAGVPFVGIPVFCDQQYILENVARRGCGIVLPKTSVNNQTLSAAIHEVIDNKKYMDSAAAVRRTLDRYRTAPELDAAVVGARKILAYLDGPRVSYFDDDTKLRLPLVPRIRESTRRIRFAD